jgi:hypothetical protein
MMESIFRNKYPLPGLEKRYDANDKQISVSTKPYDELFIWSLLLYSGEEKDVKLMKHFWSKTNHPMACCFIGLLVLQKFLSQNFIPDDLKEKITIVIK